MNTPGAEISRTSSTAPAMNQSQDARRAVGAAVSRVIIKLPHAPWWGVFLRR
jgi:hypothetical protein